MPSFLVYLHPIPIPNYSENNIHCKLPLFSSTTDRFCFFFFCLKITVTITLEFMIAFHIKNGVQYVESNQIKQKPAKGEKKKAKLLSYDRKECFFKLNQRLKQSISLSRKITIYKIA